MFDGLAHRSRRKRKHSGRDTRHWRGAEIRLQNLDCPKWLIINPWTEGGCQMLTHNVDVAVARAWEVMGT